MVQRKPMRLRRLSDTTSTGRQQPSPYRRQVVVDCRARRQRQGNRRQQDDQDDREVELGAMRFPATPSSSLHWHPAGVRNAERKGRHGRQTCGQCQKSPRAIFAKVGVPRAQTARCRELGMHRPPRFVRAVESRATARVNAGTTKLTGRTQPRWLLRIDSHGSAAKSCLSPSAMLLKPLREAVVSNRMSQLRYLMP